MKLNGQIKAFTLIELLVVVAIIGILAAVGVVAYNGYTASAKANASISNLKNIVKYISNETMKCQLQESQTMNNNLDCSKMGDTNWPDLVSDAAIKSLKDFKNPYDSNASNPITRGGQYWYDKDVGYIRIIPEDRQLQIWVCARTPCGSKPHPNVYDFFVTIE